MNEVKRWEPRDTVVGYDMQPLPDGSFVLFEAFEAEHALRIAAEKQLKILAELDSETLDGYQRKLTEAERQVGELREQLAAEPVCEVVDEKYNRVQFYRQTGDTTKPYNRPGTKLYTKPQASESAALQAKLDTAMGLLRKAWRHKCTDDEAAAIDAILNTTSTEGKDHE